ncbi:MAG TPA: TetR/AcrR family transcriptional regulator [Chloroflexota bacterium]
MPLTTHPARQRAPAMNPAERRQGIISATLPLLREYGANVTTSQIAHAAGVAEGTIFRVFEDKRELLQAALCAAMSADAEVAKIGGVSATLPLMERLVQALAAISDYQERLWSLMRALQDSGWRPDHDKFGDKDNHPRQQMRRIAGAMASLLEPDAAALRLSSRQAAGMLLALAFTNRMQEHGLGEPPATPDQLVDLFLHGALASHA